MDEMWYSDAVAKGYQQEIDRLNTIIDELRQKIADHDREWAAMEAKVAEKRKSGHGGYW